MILEEEVEALEVGFEGGGENLAEAEGFWGGGSVTAPTKRATPTISTVRLTCSKRLLPSCMPNRQASAASIMGMPAAFWMMESKATIT